MEDKKEEKATVDDKKTVGPKTVDSKRRGEVDDAANVAGANMDLEARRQSQHGDNTSSSGGANNPGQHGRDGGEIDGQTNNPAPSEAVIDPSIVIENDVEEKEIKKL